MAEDGPYLLAALFCNGVLPADAETWTLPEVRLFVTVPHGATLDDAAVQARFPRFLWVVLAGEDQAVETRIAVAVRYPGGRRQELTAQSRTIGGAIPVDGLLIPLSSVAWEFGTHWALVGVDGQEVTRVPLTIQIDAEP